MTFRAAIVGLTAGIVGGVSAIPPATAAEPISPTEVLMKITNAAVNTSFSGVFVHTSGGAVDTMRVARRIGDDGIRERLVSLGGVKREIVRDTDSVRCYLAGKNFGVRGYRQTFQHGFPRILPGNLEGLKRHYQFTGGDDTRIANRMAHQVNVLPNDEYRYGYRLWADTETGLLLRSDLIDGGGNVLDQYLFVVIDIDSEISDSALTAVSGEDKLVWYGSAEQPAADAANAMTQSNWNFGDIPDGFRLHKYMRRVLPGSRWKMEHVVFTDGLSTLSVFIKPVDPKQRTGGGLIRMGSVHIYRHRIHDHYVTVMGETPARTVELLAAGISYKG